MERKYSEVDVTWSSVERCYQYHKVIWTTRSNGIPKYTLLDENDRKIIIDIQKLNDAHF